MTSPETESVNYAFGNTWSMNAWGSVLGVPYQVIEGGVVDLSCDWKSVLEQIMRFLDEKDPERRFRFGGEDAKVFERLREEFRECFVLSTVGDVLPEALEWVRILKRAVEELKRVADVQGVTYPREFKSFVEDPLEHLKKKIFNYMYDVFRKKISVEEFERKASAAVKTSLRTNMRSCYQYWAFVTLLKLFVRDYGGKIVYPDHGYIPVERSGKQKLGAIPPNCIVYVPGKGYLSFFIEAPRPVTWEDTKELATVWKFYTALRPDMLVYGGKVMDIVRRGQDPPIERPQVIIEFKELSDWYERTRDLRGPFAKKMTAEEWRSRWIQGLWDGLADILGVPRTEVPKVVEEKKTWRVREYELVKIYKSFYKPDKMYLVTRAPTPPHIKKHLEEHGIVVIDDVGFDEKKLKQLAEQLLQHAKTHGKTQILEVPQEIVDLLHQLAKQLGTSEMEALKIALEQALKSLSRTSNR